MEIIVNGKTKKISLKKYNSYNLISNALEYYTKNIIKKERHIAPKEFVTAVGIYSIEQYGFLAKTVLNELNIHSSKDIGNLLQDLVSLGCMRLSEEDSIQEFSSPQVTALFKRFENPAVLITQLDSKPTGNFSWKNHNYRFEIRYKY